MDEKYIQCVIAKLFFYYIYLKKKKLHLSVLNTFRNKIQAGVEYPITKIKSHFF